MRVSLLILVVMLSLAAHSNAAERSLDGLLQALHVQTGVPGLAVAASRDGELIWHGEAGLADVANGKDVAPDTVFRLASVSKAICSVMAAKMVEQDLIAVDDPAGDLLPDLPEQYHELTLRDLMTHTSGLPHYQSRDFGRGRKSYASALSGLEQLGDRQLESPPGTSYLYSTHGFSLASAMMERASDTVFTGLLEHTLQSGDEAGAIALENVNELSKLRTKIYEGAKHSAPREIEREDFSYSWCGAGMEASAVELSEFASVLFVTGSPLGDEGQRLLAEPMPDRNGHTVPGDRWEMTFGLRRNTDIRENVYLHHAGVTNGARSILAIWPKSGVAVALLSNASWTGRMEDTAVAFALAATSRDVKETCDVHGKYDYSGQFRDDSIAAEVDWQDSAGMCEGRLTGDNSLTDWLGQYNFGTANGQLLIAVTDEHWGMVTPIGISILTGNSTNLFGQVGSGSLGLNKE